MLKIIPLFKGIWVRYIRPFCSSSGVCATSTLKRISPLDVLIVKGVVGFCSTFSEQEVKNNKVSRIKAGIPNPVIPHSYASPSALTQIITDKYVNHMPLYRQEAEWKRLGLKLSRTTMANWIIIASKEYFIPLVNRMHELLIQETHLHADETSVQVLNEPGKEATSKSYMWVYSSIKESQHPIKIFEYRPDRRAQNPQNFLKGFKGTIITDGYYGYNHIDGVSNAYCWAHCRRHFYDALSSDIKDAQNTFAKEAIDKIAKLFVIEKEIENHSSEEKVRVRQEKSLPLINDFFSWCKTNENKVLMHSKLGKAISYALKYEKGLRLYLKDGYVPMTNSLDLSSINNYPQFSGNNSDLRYIITKF